MMQQVEEEDPDIPLSNNTLQLILGILSLETI